MISGIVLASSLLVAAAQPPASVSTAQPEVQTLVSGLKQDAPSDIAFTEVRFLHVLQRPMHLRGELHYGGAGQLGKRVDWPYHETMTISEGQVQVQRGDSQPKKFSLERAPELGALLASFTALLGGDAITLNQFYAVVLETNAGDWRLTLTPRDPALAKQLRDMRVDGAGNRPRCFTLSEGDGDSSVMLLGTLAVARIVEPPTPAALDALCRKGAP